MITTNEAVQRIENSGGKIFYIEFRKLGGELRRMTARRGVTKGVNGRGMSYDPRERGLLVVYDMDKRGHRMVNVQGISRLHIGGQKTPVAFRWPRKQG